MSLYMCAFSDTNIRVVNMSYRPCNDVYVSKILLIESDFYLCKRECIKLPFGMSIITISV